MSSLEERLNEINYGGITYENFMCRFIDIEMQLREIMQGYLINGSNIDFRMKYTSNKDTLTIKVVSDIQEYTYTEAVVAPYGKENFESYLRSSITSLFIDLYNNVVAIYYISELNRELCILCDKCDILLQFCISDDVVADIEDDSVTIGLSIEQAFKIPQSLLFDNINHTVYKSRMLNWLKVCQTPAQLLKANLEIYIELDVYLRRRFELLLRSSYHKKYEYVGKNGVGYILTDDFIALIEISNGVERLKLSPIELNTLLYSNEELGF